MKKIYEWIVNHKVKTAIICVTIFMLPLVIVQVLYKLHLGISWLVSEWKAGDVLAYIAGVEAFLGTVFLSVVSLEQNRKAEETNKRLSEENNYLQKIMSQKLLPILKLYSLKTTRTTKNDEAPKWLPRANKFTRYISYNSASPEKSINRICVNIDVEEGIPAYVKTLTFSIRNISESVIRHICVDDIAICGYKDTFSEIRCSNVNPGYGVSSLFTADDLLTVEANFYFNSEKIKSCWDSEFGGLAVTLFFTNTTIAGIKFKEFISIYITNEGYSRVSYGERAFDEGEENNA